MTEKEKAKAYDEAIERAKKFYGNGIIEVIFPELKESKDEKIKNAILNHLKKMWENSQDDVCGVHVEDAIDWLEKQRDKDKLIQELGKYKVKYTQEVLEKYINSMNNKNNERLRKTTIAFLKDFAEQGYENAVECIDWLEKQREQEEHKFKVVDKLIQNKFDTKTLKPFDKVLARDCLQGEWTCGFFSHIVVFDDVCKYNVGEILYTMCIPYNNNTKHLVGTTKEAPEYYRYWED